MSFGEILSPFHTMTELLSNQLDQSCEMNVHGTHKQSRLIFVKMFDIFLIIDKKGNSVWIHDKKSLYAQDKAKAEEYRFLAVLPPKITVISSHGANPHLTASSR